MPFKMALCEMDLNEGMRHPNLSDNYGLIYLQENSRKGSIMCKLNLPVASFQILCCKNWAVYMVLPFRYVNIL